MNIEYIFILICLLTKKSLQDSRYTRIGRQNTRSLSSSGLFYWDLDEDFLIANWRRKCSKYNLGNSVRSFIAGGLLADMDKFPYLVGLVMLAPPRIYQCGGSLISETYVITAAHCLTRSKTAQIYIGSHLYADGAGAVYVFNVSKNNFIIKEGYDDRYGFQDDIALIQLPKPVTLSEKVKLLPLAPSFMAQSFLQGEIVTASGWGRITDNNTKFNNRLYYVATPIITHEKCKCFYLPGLVSRRMHLCADGSGGRGGCDGDSGGPLTFNYNDQEYLVGITSFGSAGGCEIGHPTVYTRVTNYLTWISAKTGIKV